MQIPTITIYVWYNPSDTGRTGWIIVPSNIELDKNNIQHKRGWDLLRELCYIVLCGLIEEEEVLIVLNNTILNYIGLQFGLAQPPNEFVYSLFRRYIIGEPTLKPCYLTSTIVSRQVTDIILTTKSSAISRLVIGQKRSNSGGAVAAATWYRSLAMFNKKRLSFWGLSGGPIIVVL